jgi:hypothetical protein
MSLQPPLPFVPANHAPVASYDILWNGPPFVSSRAPPPKLGLIVNEVPRQTRTTTSVCQPTHFLQAALPVVLGVFHRGENNCLSEKRQFSNATSRRRKEALQFSLRLGAFALKNPSGGW